MKKPTRRGLQDLVTRTNLSSDTENPHRKFLRVANLELRKALCVRVRAAAARRVAQMDEQLAEIELQQTQLLQAVHRSRGRQDTPMPPSRDRIFPRIPPQSGRELLR